MDICTFDNPIEATIRRRFQDTDPILTLSRRSVDPGAEKRTIIAARRRRTGELREKSWPFVRSSSGEGGGYYLVITILPPTLYTVHTHSTSWRVPKYCFSSFLG